MTFNFNKCNVLDIGSNNDRLHSSMNGSQLLKVNEDNGLRLNISNNLKEGKHRSETAKTTYKSIRYSGRTFEYKLEKVALTLFNAFVRPEFEQCA